MNFGKHVNDTTDKTSVVANPHPVIHTLQKSLTYEVFWPAEWILENTSTTPPTRLSLSPTLTLDEFWRIRWLHRQQRTRAAVRRSHLSSCERWRWLLIAGGGTGSGDGGPAGGGAGSGPTSPPVSSNAGDGYKGAQAVRVKHLRQPPLGISFFPFIFLRGPLLDRSWY